MQNMDVDSLISYIQNTGKEQAKKIAADKEN